MTRVQVVTRSKEDISREIASLVESGKTAVIRAKGRSMHPYIHDGVDSLVLAKADVPSLRIGDMVLARTTGNDYVMHRIIKVNDRDVILKGDGNLFGTECCRKADIIARLVGIQRDGRIIDCNTRWERIKAWAMRVAWRSAHKPLHYARRILSRNKK